jgi:anti-sigma regulatory factor (Ser/Thr protein kinase)
VPSSPPRAQRTEAGRAASFMTAESASRSVLSMRNDDREVSRMSRWFREFAAESAIPRDRAADLELCLNEVVANIIQHAYADDREHEIRIELERAAGELRATIEDDGRPFDPRNSPLPEPAPSLESTRIGGWGIPIVRALAGQILHERRDGKNRVTLAFRF